MTSRTQTIVQDPSSYVETREPSSFRFPLRQDPDLRSRLERILTVIEAFRNNPTYQDPLSKTARFWGDRVVELRLTDSAEIESALNLLKLCLVDTLYQIPSQHPIPLHHPLLVRQTRWTCEAAFIERAGLRNVDLLPHEFAGSLLAELMDQSEPCDYKEWEYDAYGVHAHQEFIKFRLNRFIQNAPKESAAVKELLAALERQSKARMERIRQEFQRKTLLLKDQIDLLQSQHDRDQEKSRIECEELRKDIRRLEAEALQIKLELEIQKQKVAQEEWDNYLNAQHLQQLQRNLEDQGSSCAIL